MSTSINDGLYEQLLAYSAAAQSVALEAAYAACRANGDEEVPADKWLLDGNGSQDDAIWRYGFAAGVRRVLAFLDGRDDLADGIAQLLEHAEELQALDRD